MKQNKSIKAEPQKTEFMKGRKKIMANIITRTITVYTYRVAEMDKETMKVNIVNTINTVIKMGKREENKLAGKNQFTLPVETNDVLVGMTLEDFYRFGTTLIPDDKDSTPCRIEEKYDVTLKSDR